MIFSLAVARHFAAGALMAFAASVAAQQAYPNRPIRMILGFPPGGSDDYMARIIAPKLAERFGQPVIVDNRPGAATNVAAAVAARANPDGYTLMFSPTTALATSRSLYAKLGYDLLKDFAFVSQVASGAYVLLAHPSLPAKSLQDFVALARSKPKAINYASAGVGSLGQLAIELLQKRAGIEVLQVHYKGAGPAVLALTAGEVQIAFSVVAAAMPMVNAKRLNALAVTSAMRLKVLPDVPTVAELGYPGFSVTNTFGLIAPAGTPAAVVEVLNAEVQKILQMDDVKAKFAAQALEAIGSTPAAFKAIIEAETAQWTRVIKDANIKVEQ